MAELLTASPTLRTSYTQQDFRDRVRSDIAQADTVFISDTEIDRWGNEAQDVIARKAEWFQYVDTFTTSGGIRDYDLPSKCVSITKVQYDVWPLAAVTLQELYDVNPLWRQLGPTQPRCYYVGGASRLTLFPTPAGASGLLIIWSALPPHPIAPLDPYYAPVGGEEAMLYYACAKASLKDMGREGMKRADYFLKLWEASLDKLCAQSRDLSAEAGTVFGGRNLRRGTGDGVMNNLWYTYPGVPS